MLVVCLEVDSQKSNRRVVGGNVAVLCCVGSIDEPDRYVQVSVMGAKMNWVK